MNPMMLPVTVAMVGIGVTLMVYSRFVSRHGQWKPITAPTRLDQMVSDVRGYESEGTVACGGGHGCLLDGDAVDGCSGGCSGADYYGPEATVA